MVKADVKRDYYADLELPPTADADDIKRRFRTLAKQYHPDRNPGREIEVTARFQAVQAAHEILSDPQLKAKYDADRVKPNGPLSTDDAFPSVFRRHGAPRPAPTTSNFPPPPRRAATSAQKHPFTPPASRTKPAPSSGADSYGAYVRAGAQQWDRTYDEAQGRAEARTAFRYMKPEQKQGYNAAPPPPPPPPPPPRPAGAGHPTAPHPAANKTPSDFSKARKSSEHFQSTPQPGFPGISRTQSTAKRAGFAPNTPGTMDEPMAPMTSAYATYIRSERPQPPNPQACFPEGASNHSPTTSNQKPVTSPLRHTRSASGMAEPAQPQRPGLERLSTRYATSGGEKTYLTSSDLNRSASVRNSPIEPRWREHDSDGMYRPRSHHGESGAPRYRGTSSRSRQDTAGEDLTTSGSSSNEEESGPSSESPRTQARQTHPRPELEGPQHGGSRVASKAGPALTGQFSDTIYKKPYAEEGNTKHYAYPPPPPRTEYAPTLSRDRLQQAQSNEDRGMNGVTTGKTGYIASRTPKEDQNMYDPFHSSSNWPRKGRSSSPQIKSYLNGVPLWAVPSSVLPQQRNPINEIRLGIVEEDRSDTNDATPVDDPLKGPLYKFDLFARKPLTGNSSFREAQKGLSTSGPYPQSRFQSASHENINSKFSAADWDGKFTSGDEYFRPTENQGSKSPSRMSRPRTQSASRGHARSPPKHNDWSEDKAGRKGSTTFTSASPDIDPIGDDQAEKIKAEAFQPGKFSAEEWAEKLKDQMWSIPREELIGNKPKTPKHGSKSSGTRKTATLPKPSSMAADATNTNPRDSAERVSSASTDTEDAMDIDDTYSETTPSSRANNKPPEGGKSAINPTSTTAANVSLNDLSNVAPFVPSSTGLKDLHDLSTNLPFESRPAASVKLSLNRTRTTSSATLSRKLHLPKPPKAIQPPSEITQHSWERYIAEMGAYMCEWSVFNRKMIEHFRSRQDQVDTNLAAHWMGSIGDGPQEITEGERGEIVGKAGYVTFMGWLEDDAKCRAWWDIANEKHRRCFEDLGIVRERVKTAAGVAGF